MSSTTPEQYSMLIREAMAEVREQEEGRIIKHLEKKITEKDERIKELEEKLELELEEESSSEEEEEELTEKDKRIKYLEEKLYSVDYVITKMFNGSGVNDPCSLDKLTEDYLREIQKIIDIKP